MRAKTETYFEAISRLPKDGQPILGCQLNEQIVVYQAFNNHVADFAVKHQAFGGAHYSYSRMSWIKPNFLWMMFRCGWASKENQERVLAIWIDKIDFENILQQAVLSSFNPSYFKSREEWNDDLNQKDARLQWDPDHNPFGGKVIRRAIQIGMKGSVLETFGKHQIKLVEDITEFVKQQKVHVESRSLDKLLVPVENIYRLTDEDLRKKVGAD